MGRLPMVSVPLRGVVLLYHTLIQKKRTIHRRSADGVEMISHLITPQNMADKFMKFIETMDMSYL